MFFDSHCHLDRIDLADFDNDFDRLLKTIEEEGVTRMLCIGVDLESFDAMYERIVGYEQVFCRQLEANGGKGDVFIGISTSGNSPNVVAALQRARELGIVTVGLTGQNGGGMYPHCDYCIQVPSMSTPRIQESHIMVGHIICGLVEEELFGGQDHQ